MQLPELLLNNYITRGFWGDEAWTAVISQLDIPQIIAVTGRDFHPPLYYLIVHGFIQLFGNTEWIRIISTVFFALSLWPLYHFAKQLAGQTSKKVGEVVAWVSTVLVAFSPILMIYAFEARSYGMVTMMSVATTMFFWNALETKKLKWWLAYALTAGLGVYTHYYLWFVFASHGFFWLAMDRKQFWRVCGAYAFIFLAQLPWIPTLFGQVQEVAGDYWIGAMNSRTHWEYFMRVVAGDFMTKWQAPQAKIMLAGVVVSLVLMLTLGKKGKGKKKSVPRGYWLLWFWWLVPVLLPTLISFYRPVFFYRYLVFTSVPILLILIWGASLIRKEVVYAVGALILFFYLQTDYLIFRQFPRSMREVMSEAFASETPPSADVPVYTYLPSFAEVYFYTNSYHTNWPEEQRAPVKVVPEGLVQFSGRSLLDKYEELGLVEIQELPEDSAYWHMEPGPASEYVAN